MVAWSDRKTWRAKADAERTTFERPPARVVCPDCGAPPFTAHRASCKWAK